MNKKLKLFLIVFLSLVLFVILGFLAFVGSIKKQRSCAWANIDNIEIHAHINIPKVSESVCNYDAASNTKMASFILSRNELDVDRYLQINKLKKIQSFSGIEYDRFLNLDQHPIQNSLLYYRKNTFRDETSYVLYDLITSKLWVTIEYRD